MKPGGPIHAMKACVGLVLVYIFGLPATDREACSLQDWNRVGDMPGGMAGDLGTWKGHEPCCPHGDESAAAPSRKLRPKLEKPVGHCRQKEPNHWSASAKQQSRHGCIRPLLILATGRWGRPGPGGACLRRQLADSAEDVAVSAIFYSSVLYLLERKHLGQRQKKKKPSHLQPPRHSPSPLLLMYLQFEPCCSRLFVSQKQHW